MKDHQAANPARYQSLDHWRGIACLLVVIYHATLPFCEERRVQPARPADSISIVRVAEPAVSTGNPRIAALAKLLVGLTNQMHVGVAMFFVISGYCVTASAESLRRSQGPTREYFRRRAVRIYPPFWCAVGFSILFCWLAQSICPGRLGPAPWPLRLPWDLHWSHWLGCLTLTGTWLENLTGDPSFCFPVQAWTLCYEEQFYAVVGLLLILSRRQFFGSITALTIGIALVDVIALRRGVSLKGWFFDEHWFMFAAGVGLYWQLNHATKRQSLAYQFIAVSLILVLSGAAVTRWGVGTGSHFSAWRVAAAVLFAVVLNWLKAYDQKIAGMKMLNWLKSCGVMCYSIYLIHLFPGKWLSRELMLAGYHDHLSTLLFSVPLCLATAISLGYIFHVAVESHFLSTRKVIESTAGTPAISEEVVAPLPIVLPFPQPPSVSVAPATEPEMRVNALSYLTLFGADDDLGQVGLSLQAGGEEVDVQAPVHGIFMGEQRQDPAVAVFEESNGELPTTVHPILVIHHPSELSEEESFTGNAVPASGVVADQNQKKAA